MPQIKFTHHWSKLDCPKGSLFTTIRSDHGNKAQYYMEQEGIEHEKDIPMSLASKIIEELKNKGGQ